jgi:hypothetical protein
VTGAVAPAPGGLGDVGEPLQRDGSAAAEAAREARLRRLRERTDRDPVLASEVAEFLARDWRVDGEDALAENGERYCRLSSTEIVMGHKSWPGAKRIPL